MLDPRLFRTDIEAAAAKLARRGFQLDIEIITRLETERKQLQMETQELQNERNTSSKSIGQAKARGEDIQPLLDAVANLGDRLKQAEARLTELQQELNTILMGVPNIPDESVPDGKDEDDNVEIRRWGEPRQFDFEALSKFSCRGHGSPSASPYDRYLLGETGEHLASTSRYQYHILNSYTAPSGYV